MASSSSTPNTHHTPNISLPTLSCEFCRRRKIKCDKLDPCTNCQRAGVKCESIRRKRLPRGRHITKSTASSRRRRSSSSRDALREKIDRLEALVNVALSESAGKDGSGSSPAMRGSAVMDKEISSDPLQGANGFRPKPMVSQFWANVINEIRESRGLASEDTEDDEEEEDDEDEDEEHSEQQQERAHLRPERHRTYSPFMGLSLARLGHALPHSLLMRPSPAVTTTLCDIYLDQFDRIIKILHRPSLKRHFSDGIPYSISKSSREAENALDMAVFYAAVTSMTDRQCRDLFQCGRIDVLPEYQTACEMALERVDLMRTTDMMVLQAFVIYLAATRTHDKTRAVWTLLATAVRVAQALNLHVESLGPSETFFNQQMRKRLWFTMCLLDVQTCFDPDSQPLIPIEMTQFTLPRNVNDSDFNVSFTGAGLPERDDVTDLTFALITYNLQACTRRLYYIPRGEYAAREEVLNHFKDKVLPLTRHCNPDESNYSWLIYWSSQNLVSSTQLIFRRATQTSTSPQSTCLLEHCLKNLENIPRIHGDVRGEGFRWYISPQWPLILLAIKECFVTTDVTLLKRAWPLMEDVVGHYRNKQTDPGTRSKKAMLKKLMKRARRRVDALIQSADAVAAEEVTENMEGVVEEQQQQQMDLFMNVSWDDLLDDFQSITEFPYGDLIDWTV
ncbi:C6 transcription factor, putative [Talaromyces stipitatus ATCC 10500]|uniref:C6 transcription factor, putative n=1 Tax=Talaromyces stipitatus (strain ATCC 10500 / CBS 375.48 / QM 6759 / NRRL 1006) TaxID=441959 RepID=B8LW16_TALSN|nr:C6 transcription factor, putative [Talaromyces stipitatus ATCC 10500]EED24382.1 C6 transcription factor, putative [Talaromyces stipitatus ATCC 10500]